MINKANRIHVNILIYFTFFIALIVWGVFNVPAVVLVNLGNISISKGHYQTAEALFNIAYHQSGHTTLTDWGLGQTYYQLNKQYLSQSAFEKFLINSKNRSNLAHFYLGQIYAKNGMQSEAILEWRLSKSANYFENTGNKYRFEYDWMNAAQNYLLAYQIDPKRKNSNAWSKFSLGQLALSNNNPRSAANYFQEAIELNPDNYDTYLGLGVSWLRLNDIDKAESAFLSALKINKSSFWPHYYLGVINYHQGQCLEAINLFLDAKKLTVDHQPTYVWLARSYRKCGDAQKAISEYKKAIEINPADTQTKKELEQLLP